MMFYCWYGEWTRLIKTINHRNPRVSKIFITTSPRKKTVSFSMGNSKSASQVFSLEVLKFSSIWKQMWKLNIEQKLIFSYLYVTDHQNHWTQSDMKENNDSFILCHALTFNICVDHSIMKMHALPDRLDVVIFTITLLWDFHDIKEMFFVINLITKF